MLSMPVTTSTARATPPSQPNLTVTALMRRQRGPASIWRNPGTMTANIMAWLPTQTAAASKWSQ